MNKLYNPGTQKRGSLSFSLNWNNKLFCDAFTVFRPYEPTLFYTGREFNVFLDGKFLKPAIVVDIQVITLNQVTEWVARLDTGLSRQQFVKMVNHMYKDKGYDFETQQWSRLLLQTIIP